MKKILILSAVIFSCASVNAQQRVRTKLSGYITDALTGKPLNGANILVSDSRTGTSSDSTGYYILYNIPPAHAIIEISHTGYRTIVEHLDISGDDHRQDFKLFPAVLENEGITVTAVANATSIRKAPFTVSRINQRELLNTTASNIIDALSRQPGVSQIASGPAVSKPVIRGLGYNRIVVINDGVRQEGQQWGDEHGIEIDEHSVNRVEIVKGPASLIYGSDAIAGVINIISTAPVPVNTIRGQVLSSYQTNNRQHAVSANLAGNRDGWNWNAWGTYKAAGDYKNRYDGSVYNSRYSEKNAGGYVGLNRSWGYSHFIVSSFNQKPGMIEGERNASGNFVRPGPGGIEVPVSNGELKDMQPAIPYQHVHHLKFTSDNSFRLGKNRLSITIGLQQNKRREYGDADEPDVAELFFDLQTLNYNTAFHMNDRNGWSTSIGLNGMFQQNTNRGEEVLIPEYRLFDLGAFLYAQKIKDRTTLSGGFRFDHRDLNSSAYFEGSEMKFESFQRRFSNLSASAGISREVNDNFILKFNLASGFRAPGIPELASNGTHEGTNRYEYGDRDLRSERSYQADAGLNWNSEHLSVSASVFYNSINNFIFYSRLPSVCGGDSLVLADGEYLQAFRFGQRNAYLTGGELLVDLHPHPLDWLHWENRFSFVAGRFREALEGVSDLPLMPAPRWVSEVKADFLKQGRSLRNLSFHFELDHNFRQANPFTPYGTETETPSYTLLNAGISTDVVAGKRTLFSVFFHAMNMGDVAYQNHLSRLKYTAENMATGRTGVFNMGRNFSIRIRVPFGS